ncbi:MAG: sensor histidine kinase [Mariprofundaceae bacterium]
MRAFRFAMFSRIKDSLYHTFRGRLALLYITIELSVLIFAGVLLYVVLSNRMYADADEQLLKQATVIVDELERTPFNFWMQNLSRFANHYPGSVQLVGANGMLLFKSDRGLIGRGGDEATVALRHAMENKVAIISTSSLLREGSTRVVAMPVHRANRVVAVAMLGRSLDQIHDFFELMYLVGGVLGFLSMIITAYAGYVLAQRALRPVDEIARTARAVAAGNLSRRLKSFSQDKEIAFLIRMLNKMFADLESSFKAQKRFTADASHELRIPLTVMKGEIEVALRRPRSTEEYAHTLRQQLGIIERMQRIVDGLLMLARADAGLLQLKLEDVDLSLLLREVGQHHLGLFTNKNIKIQMDIDEELQITGDRDRLERVVFNLLNNAYKYAPEGSEVHLSGTIYDGQAMIRVSDHGPGIAKEHLPQLFDRFYRADEARNREAGGAGLGLAICKRIIEAHGGKIWVESQLGAGTSFRILLPLSGPDPKHARNLKNLLQDQG